jgi:hypothetical protein
MSNNEIVTEQEKQEFLLNARNDPVFFVERVLRDEDFEHYTLEPYQKEFLRCPARNKLLFWARRLSKSLLMLLEILHKSTFNRGFLSMMVSPTWDQSIELGERLLTIVDATPEIDSIFETKAKKKPTLKNGSRITFASAGREGRSQLGRGVHYLAFDEAQQVPEEVYTFLRPTLLGQKKGKKRWLVLGGTPLGRVGMFHDTYKKGRLFIKMDGIYENPELSQEEAESDYIVFERPTAILDKKGNVIGTGTDRVSISELKQEMRDLPQTGFLREYCLQFLDSIGEVFPQSLLNQVTDQDFKIEDGLSSDKEIVMGLDLGKHRFNSVLTVLEVDKGKTRVIHTKAFPLETDYHKVIEDVIKLKNRYPNAIELRMDETGVGEGVTEIAERRAAKLWRNLSVVGFNFAGPRKKNMLIENAVAELESGRFSMLFDSKMQNEMLEFKREVTDKNNIVYRKPAGGSDDYVDSLALSLLAAKDYMDDEDPSLEVVETGTHLLGEAQRGVRRIMRNYR